MGDISETITRLLEARGWTLGQLAYRAELPRTTVVSLVKRGSKRPSHKTIIKIAGAFGVSPEELDGSLVKQPLVESYLDQWERAKLAAPVPVPVYAGFEVPLGRTRELLDYVYVSPKVAAGKSLGAFRCDGDCMQPYINDGDLIIIDTEAVPREGDIILCMVDDKLIVGRYRMENGRPVIKNGHGAEDLSACQKASVIIGRYTEFPR